jgi:hypothetical protein
MDSATLIATLIKIASSLAQISFPGNLSRPLFPDIGLQTKSFTQFFGQY